MTSIEWLENELKNSIVGMSALIKHDTFEKAKEMHKQEIIDSWKMGRYDSDKIVMSERFYSEQYYNETFKQ